MVIPVFLLLPVGIPVAFSVTHLLPRYALGFLVGSLGLVRLAARVYAGAVLRSGPKVKMRDAFAAGRTPAPDTPPA